MTIPSRKSSLLTVTDLSIGFRPQDSHLADAAPLVAVRELDLAVHRGETLAIVGESGCGKSVTALALAGLLPGDAKIVSGTIDLLNNRLSALPESGLRGLRGNRIGVIFQDPMSALNPVLTIGEQIEEAILAHQSIQRREASLLAEELLAQVRIPNPRRTLLDYPHQLSGGMRQRVMIAIAISNRPDLLIADEPTTALDAAVQSEILHLLHDIQRASGMALILITHDLALVSRWADRVAVMYAGRKVEERLATDLLEHPMHPYTSALIRARPSRRPPSGKRQRLTEIPGVVPALGVISAGCAFSNRCPQASDLCRREAPPIVHIGETGMVACHFAPEAA